MVPNSIFLQKNDSCWDLIQNSRRWALAIVEAFKTCWHSLEGCKHEILLLTDHNNLCQFIDTKVWALVRSGGLKGSLGIIFALIIIKKKPTELQTRCLTSFRRIKWKETSYELKTLGFFINCSFHWPMSLFRASAPKQSYHYFTKFSSTALMCSPNSGICFEPS